jgi:hypothetical protein
VSSVIWWVVIVLVAGPLVVLAVALALVLRRLGALREAVRRLLLRARDAQALALAVTALQQRADALGQEVADISDRTGSSRTATGR